MEASPSGCGSPTLPLAHVASRAEELVMQIATSVEGLFEVAACRDADGVNTRQAASDIFA